MSVGDSCEPSQNSHHYLQEESVQQNPRILNHSPEKNQKLSKRLEKIIFPLVLILPTGNEQNMLPTDAYTIQGHSVLLKTGWWNTKTRRLFISDVLRLWEQSTYNALKMPLGCCAGYISATLIPWRISFILKTDHDKLRLLATLADKMGKLTFSQIKSFE